MKTLGPSSWHYPLIGVCTSVALLIVLASTTAADPQGAAGMFPEPTPIQNARPEVRKPVKIKIPETWIVTRTREKISIEAKSWKEIEVQEGSGLETGVKSECYIYPEGTARPQQLSEGGLENGHDLSNLAKVSADVKLGGVPKPGTNYVVELVLTFFDTDIPAQHMWGPEGGKLYKANWNNTYKWVVPAQS